MNRIGIAPPGHRLPDLTRLGPVRLQVANAARSEAFYTEVLGLVRHGEENHALALGAPGAKEPLIELVERTGARPLTPRSRLGLYHFAVLLPDRAALARFALHARSRNIRLGMGDHLVSEALYLTDPDGLGIEVYADRPRESWRSTGGQLTMTTDPLDVENLLAAAGDTPFNGVPPDTVIGHVHLHIGDLTEAERFYHEALGFDKMVWTYPGALFLSAGGYHHHLGTNTWARGAPSPGPDEARLLSWTIVVPEAGDKEGLRGHMRDRGIDIRDADGGGFLVRDPWGTTVEVRDESRPGR